MTSIILVLPSYWYWYYLVTSIIIVQKELFVSSSIYLHAFSRRRSSAAWPSAADVAACLGVKYFVDISFFGTASERRGNIVKSLKTFFLKDKARIWPWLSCMCHLEIFGKRFFERQGQNLALTVLYVPHWLDSGESYGILSFIVHLSFITYCLFIVYHLGMVPGGGGGVPGVRPPAILNSTKSPFSGPWFALALTEIQENIYLPLGCLQGTFSVQGHLAHKKPPPPLAPP